MTQSVSPGRPLVPSRRLRVLAAACFVVAATVHGFEWPESAWANVLTLVGLFVGTMLLLVWFVLRSGYSRSLRYGTAAALALALGAACATLEIEGVDGSLVPRFKWRSEKRADELLAKVAAAGLRADLATTTPSDYPRFLGADGRAVVQGVRLDPEWSLRPPKLLWKQPIGAGWSAFAVVNGFAVTMEQRGPEELVVCREIAAGGRIVWAHSLPVRHFTIEGGVGPRSTPTIHGGRVYALGATGVLRCLDGATGELIWRQDLVGKLTGEPGRTPGEGEPPEAADDRARVAWGRSASPLVVGQRVIVPAGGPEGNQAALAAFRLDDGRPIWRSGPRQVAYASPELATLDGVRQLVIVNEDYITGHDVETGAELWAEPWPGKSYANASVSQCFPVGPDRLLVSKGYGGGAKVFRVRQAGGRWTSEVVAENHRPLRTKFANVVVRQGHAYGLSDGILECVEVDTLRSKWKRGRYGHGQTMLVGDLLLVQAESGEVALVEASPRAYRELARFQALEGNTWNNPALAGSRLLVRNAVEAACYELPLQPAP